MSKTELLYLNTDALFKDIPRLLIPLFEKTVYPWEVLPNIKDYVKALIDTGLEGYTEIAPDVFVGENTKIHPSATIAGPTIIGSNCDIRPSAFIRGSVFIGDGCVVGNSCELKNAILMNKVQVPHFNYVGDSVLGSFSHMGAGSICSNLKADKSLVVVHAEEPIETKIKKFGAILADGADIGCNTVLNPGTVICNGSRVYPQMSVRGVVPPYSIFKSQNNIVPIK